MCLAVYGEQPCQVVLASNEEASAMAGEEVSWTGQEQEAGGWNNMGGYGWGGQQGGSGW